MQPEWMVAPPGDLQHAWYVAARPEGRRCLVVASRGSTLVRDKRGAVVLKAPTALPNGSQATQEGSESFSILDCILDEAAKTFHVMDLMCWRGYLLYDCDTEFRQFWVQTKLAECAAGVAGAEAEAAGWEYAFAPVGYFEASSAGILQAYQAPAPYAKNGLFFAHREAHYQLGLTPLCLVWKDPACCRYFVDTERDGTVPERQTAVLRLLPGGALAGTGDDPPVPACAVEVVDGRLHGVRLGAPLQEGAALRFSLGPAGPGFAGGLLELPWRFEGPAKGRDRPADTFSKIVFQRMARTAPLGLRALLEAAIADDAEM